MNPTDYPVFLIYSKEDNAWLARVDLLPGCVAEGATQEEALANSREAIKTWIEVSKELKRSVPKAFDAQELEELQLQANASQGEQIQKLVNETVARIVQQLQASASTAQFTGGELAIGRRGQFYSTPPGLVVAGGR